MYTPLFKNWFYSFIDIDEEKNKIIKQEFIRLTNELDADYAYKNGQYNTFILRYRRDLINSYTPTFIKWLRDKGLTDCENRFSTYLFSPPNQCEISIKPHVDCYRKTVKFSLLFPLENCENTYTVFYKTDNINVIMNDDYKNVQGFFPAYGRYFGETEPEEICRVESTKPYILNTTILHGFHNPLKKERRINTIRFDPELSIEEFNRLIK
jgi:hypothetical protein